MAQKRHASRAVYGVFVVLVGLFVASSIAQVQRRVFGAPDGAEFPVGEACASAMEAQMKAIEAARLVASTEADADAAKARYTSERAKAGAKDTLCLGDPRRDDALAALARLDRASEALAVRSSRELSPVRLAARSFIRGPR